MRNIFAVTILFAVITLSSPAQMHEMKSAPEHPLKAVMAELQLTPDQKSQVQKIHFENQKKEIELKAKLETKQLEMRNMLMTDTPDKSSLEKAIQEVGSAETVLKINKMSGWFEINIILTPDQQKHWIKVLRQAPMKKMRMMGRGRDLKVPMEQPHPMDR